MSRKHGVVTAFVKEVDAAQGRIRVKYRDIDDQLDSGWAYVASPMAGKGRGALFMPEPNDEVLIAFGDSDFDYPYVVGFLWNGSQKSPETDPNNRVIVTPGGHELRFEDKGNAAAGGRVILKSNGGHKITLDDAPGAGKISIEVAGGSIAIDLTTVPPGVTIRSSGNTVTMGVSGIGLAAAAPVTITAPAAFVNSPLVSFSGVVQCQALVTQSVVSPLYTPGIGNFI
jgi:phage baseplate assembly protein gpV